MNPVSIYASLDAAYPYIIRGTNQQTDTALLWKNPSFGTDRLRALAVGYFSLHNRSAAAVVLGLGVRIPNYLWKAGQWTDATTTYTDDTTDAQDADANDFALETTTNNDGYVILSRVPFNAVSINVTTASVDAVSVARAVRFSNAAGTGWATAPANLFQQTASATNYATGENVVVFAAPVDWGKSSSLATNLPDGYYAMNVRATDAPGTTAGLAQAIEIYRMYFLTEAIADNGTLSQDFGAKDFVMGQEPGFSENFGDALVAMFGTANDQNRVTAQVRAL